MLEHSKHFTLVEAFPKIVCEALHLEHFTRTNFPFLSILLGKEGAF